MIDRRDFMALTAQAAGVLGVAGCAYAARFLKSA